MKAQDFADKCANIFLLGLPVTVAATPVLATALAEFAGDAAPFIKPALNVAAFMGYIGIPIIGLAGACLGIWCYLRNDYRHRVSKLVLVLVVLAAYAGVATVATKAYTSMKHKTAHHAPPGSPAGGGRPQPWRRALARAR